MNLTKYDLVGNRQIGLRGADRGEIDIRTHGIIALILERGTPPKRIKEHSGHFFLDITEIYTHALPHKTIDEDILDFEINAPCPEGTLEPSKWFSF